MAIGQIIDDISERFAVVETALRAAMSSYVYSEKGLQHFDAFEPEQLKKGVVMMVSGKESGYQRAKGSAGKRGTQRLIISVLLQVDETATPATLQAKEFAAINNIKSFARTGVAGVGLVLDSVEQSRQTMHPYGWVVSVIDAGPPLSTLA